MPLRAADLAVNYVVSGTPGASHPNLLRTERYRMPPKERGFMLLVSTRPLRSAAAAAPRTRPSSVEPLESRSLLSVTIQIDYSLDTSGFFADPARRTLMQQAADALDTRLADTLSAVVPSGSNTWNLQIFHPARGRT